MKRTITVHLYDQYESDQSLIRRIDAIRKKTHQSYGQILTEILMNKEEGVAGLSDQAVARTAEKTAEIILERLPQILSDLYPLQGEAHSEAWQLSDMKNSGHGNTSESGTSATNREEPDFSNSTLDFDFIGI